MSETLFALRLTDANGDKVDLSEPAEFWRDYLQSEWHLLKDQHGLLWLMFKDRRIYRLWHPADRKGIDLLRSQLAGVREAHLRAPFTKRSDFLAWVRKSEVCDLFNLWYESEAETVV